LYVKEDVMLENVGVHEKGEISVQHLIDFIKSNRRFSEVGAVACFLGFMRGYTSEGEQVAELELEAYKEPAEEALKKIAEDIKIRPGIVDAVVHHVTGELNIGDLIMVAMVAGRSRKDVFPALVEMTERVKREAPIWKRETLATGKSYWVSEKEVDI